MCKHLVLAAALGALAMIPTPASAHGHAPVHPNVGSSFGMRIIVRDGPEVVRHHHHSERFLRPQPWPRHFRHHASTWGWRGPWHHQTRHFQWRDRDHRPWFDQPGSQHFKHGDGKRWSHFKHGDGKRWSHFNGGGKRWSHFNGGGKRWSHVPWQHGRGAVRDHSSQARFMHGHPGSGPRRHW